MVGEVFPGKAPGNLGLFGRSKPGQLLGEHGPGPGSLGFHPLAAQVALETRDSPGGLFSVLRRIGRLHD
ncbi:hypothetical protein ACFQ71_38355 [Streptomyces sp. NPDC056534]|uniref:hypothetical protein n=1 Tax=Streptomyces sp. NPDC056534 TaxID=3345857 RepID=UPI0036ADFA97